MCAWVWLHFHRESGLLINCQAEIAAKTAHSIIEAYGNAPKILTPFAATSKSQIKISQTEYKFWFKYNLFVKKHA